MRPARAALLLLGLAACRRLAPPDVVARIDGAEVVRAAEFARYLETSAGEDGSELSPAVLSSLFDQFLGERLLRRLAVDRELVGPAASPREAVAALLRSAPAEAVAESEIAAHYAARPGAFSRPERLRLRQILTLDRETAERARAEVVAGAEFSEVARRISRGARARRGGFQGELGRDDLPPAFAETLFALPPGAISPVLEAAYGYHVFQVTAHLRARQLTLAEAREEIRATLERERRDRALAALVREARGRYDLTVYASNLPFEYSARPTP